MSHDVFISHARKDKEIADAICEKLESAELRCWIADRDISAGEDWTEVTRKAISSSRVMVLVLSENANAAPHIEREIAHAFYTGRMIIPLRVTDTLPRRDFLFYLGNVRCFDASRPPAEQHLEAFAASVNGMMRGPAATGKPVPLVRSIEETERSHFSDSWLGSLHASHYRTLELLKRGAIVIGVVAVALLLWFSPWQTRDEDPLAQENRQATLSDRNAVSDSRPQTTRDIPSKPAYTYSRLGLWVPTNTGSATAEQPPKNPPTSSDPQPATAAAPPGPDGDQKGSDETESSEDRESGSTSHPRLTGRQEMHRRKGRLRHHIRRVAASDESFAEHIKRGFQSVWHKIVDGNR